MKNLIKLLDQLQSVDEYKILNRKVSSKELFFIKDKLQMNRKKDVEYFDVTVYKNIEENGKKFKGSSQVTLSPTMTIDEMKNKIEIGALAASFVKNEYYSLVKPTDDVAPKIQSAFSEGNIIDSVSKLVKDVYKMDTAKDAFINSSEFFINKTDIHLVNSVGLDISETRYDGEIELIIEAKGKTEEIELFEAIRFADYNPEEIKQVVKEQLYFASLRAKAIPMPQVENIPVLIKGTEGASLFDFYHFNASASQYYSKLHQNKVGDNVQGEDVQGDKVTITLKPYIPNSSVSRYYDQDGIFLRDTLIYKDGEIMSYVASKRFADYLNIKPTGIMRNIVIEAGSKSINDMRQGPYLEVLKFSDFQCDAMTGNFGGEFRLGIYHDGQDKIPVTLGSISGDINKCQKNMYLSKELGKINRFILPALLEFSDMTIAGNK